VPRPCRGAGGTAPPPSVGELGRLLQWGAHAPCTRQGYAAPSPCADSRAYRISHLARRSPSVLRSDRIIGRHNYRKAPRKRGARGQAQTSPTTPLSITWTCNQSRREYSTTFAERQRRRQCVDLTSLTPSENSRPSPSARLGRFRLFE